jgi:L-alanine-DL-glutamate epimerase-like enolase superfamily enzyme
MNVCDLSGYVAPHVAPDGPKRKNGRLAPPEGAGLGITPDLDVLGAPALELE